MKDDTTKRTTLSSIRNFKIQIAYFSALEVATYSTSIVKSIIQDYFTSLQLIASPPRVDITQN